jgi:beta-glucosidase/6-phospho-beta-glucosidase/beta-galactosidase
VAGRSVEYALAVYRALHDRVANWTTLNEPWCAAFLGHAAGVHAPGVRDPATAVRAAHHLLLAHGQATRAMRALDAGPRLGINLLNLDPVTPASTRPTDLDAARRIDGLYNRLFLDPLFRGRYPADVLEDLGGLGGLDRVDDGDLAAVSAPLDLLGVNYYRRWTVAGRPAGPRRRGRGRLRGLRRGPLHPTTADHRQPADRGDGQAGDPAAAGQGGRCGRPHAPHPGGRAGGARLGLTSGPRGEPGAPLQ